MIENYKELWQSIFGESYRDKFIFDYNGYKLTGGGGNYPSYDLRLAQDICLTPDYPFALSHAIENFNVPDNIMMIVCNKSTIARLGINASCCTFIDNGFKGDLTIELMLYNRVKSVELPKGIPIVQVVAMPLIYPCESYAGKYQNQKKTTGAK